LPCAIYDAKKGFTHNAIYIARGVTDMPAGMCYLSNMPHESTRIVFFIATLNELEIVAFDISNDHLNTPFYEKIYFVAGCKLIRCYLGWKAPGQGGEICLKTI